MIVDKPISETALPEGVKQLHVLTLTPFYPKRHDEAWGCFISEPLTWIGKLRVTQTVLAVQPFYYGHAEPSLSAPPASWRRFFLLPSGFGLASSGAFLSANLLAQVRRLHAANPIHLIHAHSALPCGHAALLLSRELGIPYVVTVHGLDAYSDNQVRGFAGRWCRRVSRRVYHAAQRVVCISEKVRDRVVEGAAADVKTTVVYNGVDTGVFSPGDETEEKDVILSIGALIPIKGHELLLKAMAAMHNRFPTYSCDIIGDGPEHTRLSRLAVDLNISRKVRFLGRQSREQVVRAMRRCSLFALPSRYEGLGCVYLEGMSMEKAVVACRGQGIEEVIQHGINGWLVSPDDAQELSNVLSALIQNRQLRRDVGTMARRAVIGGFTLAHQAARLAHVYRECAR